ncbi:MAG: YebC/PmpR family DNA-binding transcriptional regulator [Clostridia bacterium]|nr:YebC/PmpR family DNA-binding transcriptional regulator [Clostridia bacterium]
MSGHNKWSKIHRKKGLADAARSNVYTKLGKEIIVAVKMGGSGDPELNSKLKEVIAKAKSNNMPNDNIKRAIAKGLGDGNDANYDSMVYEGYGPAGVAVIVEALTNNKNRTAGDVRSYFDKSGGALGVSGSVSFLFNRLGLISVANQTEDSLLEILIDSPIEDLSTEDGIVTITVKPENFNGVLTVLEQNKIQTESAEIAMVPMSTVAIPDDKIASFEKLIDTLENNEDVQAVYHNAE